MQTGNPDPRNPWPHEMVLSIDQPRVPLLLLYARALRGLAIPEVPELESGPTRSAGEVAGATAGRWRSDWARWWNRHIPRSPDGPDPETARLLRELGDAELVEHVAAEPRGWLTPTEHEAFAEWRTEHREPHNVPLEQTPERLCLDSLVPAWRAGLTTILELPFVGDVADRISADCLVVSRRTRWDPQLYRQALAKHPEP